MPHDISNVPLLLGVICIEVVLFNGRYFLILKSGSTTSSRQELGSLRKKLIVVCLFL
jgi:hypothetical protein